VARATARTFFSSGDILDKLYVVCDPLKTVEDHLLTIYIRLSLIDYCLNRESASQVAVRDRPIRTARFILSVLCTPTINSSKNPGKEEQITQVSLNQVYCWYIEGISLLFSKESRIKRLRGLEKRF
jgi:hypothetical protein